MNLIKKTLKIFDKGERKQPVVSWKGTNGSKMTLESSKRIEKLQTECPVSTQDLVEPEEVYDDGIIRIRPRVYSKSLFFHSGQYFLSENHEAFASADVRMRTELGCDMQFTYIKRAITQDDLINRLSVPGEVNGELSDKLNEFILHKQIESTNGYELIKMITLISYKSSYEDAKADLDLKEKTLRKHMLKLGCQVANVSLEDRLQLFKKFYRKDDNTYINMPINRKKFYRHDFKNDIAPLSFAQKSDYVRFAKDNYCRAFFAGGYMDKITHDLMNEILALDCEIMMSVNHTAVPRYVIEKRIYDIDYSIERRMQKEQTNNNKSMLIRQPLSARLREDAEKAKQIHEDHELESSFMISASAVISAGSKQDLNIVSDKFIETCSGKGVTFLPALYKQRECIATALPHGVRFIKNAREMVASSAFLYHPYWSAEVFESGVWYGANQITNSPIMADVRRLDNPHQLVFGCSGASKSGTVKLQIMQILLKKFGHVIIFDPTLEYKNMVESFGGAYVNVSMKSDVRINPLEIPFESIENSNDRADFKASKSELLRKVLGECMDGRDTSMHRNLLDTAVANMYDFYLGKKNKDKKQPILNDLMEYIYKVPDARMEERGIKKEDNIDTYKTLEKTANEVVESFKALTSGSINFFAEESNLDIWDNELVTVGFSDTRNTNKGSLYNIAVTVFMDYVETIASRNMKKGIDTYFYIDELHELLRSEIISAHLTSRWKTARHSQLILTGILQDISNITENKECKQLLTNSSTVVILKQQPANLKIICRECNITESEGRLAIDCEQGTGIVKFGPITLPFDIRVPDDLQEGILWDIIHTDKVSQG